MLQSAKRVTLVSGPSCSSSWLKRHFSHSTRSAVDRRAFTLVKQVHTHTAERLLVQMGMTHRQSVIGDHRRFEPDRDDTNDAIESGRSRRRCFFDRCLIYAPLLCGANLSSVHDWHTLARMLKSKDKRRPHRTTTEKATNERRQGKSVRFHSKRTSLEFQLIDTKNRTNARIISYR